MAELTNASGIEIPEALTCSINDSSWDKVSNPFWRRIVRRLVRMIYRQALGISSPLSLLLPVNVHAHPLADFAISTYAVSIEE